MTHVVATAPGKVVIAGEYAVLDGAPAIAMAVDRRARVEIKPGGAKHHAVIAPGFSTAECRFIAGPKGFEWLDAGEPFAIVEAAWRAIDVEVPANLELILDTREFYDASGTKIGVGSSAALTVALTAALHFVAGSEADLLRDARAAHRDTQSGAGSGVDVACSVAGGVIEYRAGDQRVESACWPAGLQFALFWSRVPANTKVRLAKLDSRASRPSRSKLAEAAERMARCWKTESVEAVLDGVRDYVKVLRRFSVDHGLGIFDAGHAALADAAGDVVYKPCGAGGGDVGIALATDAAAIASFVDVATAHEFEPLDMTIAERGVDIGREDP